MRIFNLFNKLVAVGMIGIVHSAFAVNHTASMTVDEAHGVIIIPAVEGGADVAVAMVDRRITTPDTLTTIASQLLLQSDLRGHIEDAAWYLRVPAEEALPAADALMLTQGWTRYDIPATIRGAVTDSLAYPLEIGAQLDGTILSKWRGKPLAGVTTNVLAPKMADGASAITDSLGRFHITGLEWPESTYFVISAMNSKGKLEENIHPEFDTFPTIASLRQENSINETSAPELNNNYVDRLNSSPQGMQISLREVVVKGTRNKKEGNILDMLASVNIRPGENSMITSYEDAVANIPGVNVINDCLMYHTRPVAIWVDGRYYGNASDGAQRIRDAMGANRWTVPQKTSSRPSRTPAYKGLGEYSAAIAASALSENTGTYTDTGLLTDQLKLIDLESMFPFLENESVAYVPPHLSLLFPTGSGGAAGGILSITTKNPGKFQNKLSPEFKAVSPLGYQKAKKFYVPKYTPEGVAEELTGATLRWLPSVDLSRGFELPLPPGMKGADVAVTVEGLTPQGAIVEAHK